MKKTSAEILHVCTSVCVCVYISCVVVEAAEREADLSGCKGHILQQSAHLQLPHIREEVRQSQIRSESFYVPVFNRCQQQ